MVLIGRALLVLPLVVEGGLRMVELHGPQGQTVWVNPTEVVSVRTPQSENRKYLVRGARCVVTMTNGNIFAVLDECDEVMHRIEEVQ